MRHRKLKTIASLLLICAPAAMLAQQTDLSGVPPQPGQLARPEQAVQPGHSKELPDTVTAVPFTVRDKFDYRIVQSYGLRGFIGSALAAGIGQGMNSPHEWGQGIGGYGERYASSFAGNFSRQSFSWVLESAFHEDPRYFPSEAKQNHKERLINALKQSLITKTDSGGDEFAYARVIAAFGAGQFENVWLPKSDSSVAHGVERGAISIASDAAYDVMQEFLPFTRPISLRSHKPTAPTVP